MNELQFLEMIKVHMNEEFMITYKYVCLTKQHIDIQIRNSITQARSDDT